MAKKKRPRRQRREIIRVNEKIRANRVRVLSPEGAQLGVMDLRDAVKAAKSVGLTLVEVAGNVDPPVTRIVDYGKWRYDQSKQKKSKPAPALKMKEVKFRVRTEEHDYNIKMGRLEEFLDAGFKVRVQLQFRGRENAHKELGVVVLKRVKEDAKSMGICDQEPRIAGRAVSMVLSPLPKGQRKRQFKLIHGDLIEPDDEDDFEDDDSNFDDEGNEIVIVDSPDEKAETPKKEESAEEAPEKEEPAKKEPAKKEAAKKGPAKKKSAKAADKKPSDSE